MHWWSYLQQQSFQHWICWWTICFSGSLMIISFVWEYVVLIDNNNNYSILFVNIHLHASRDSNFQIQKSRASWKCPTGLNSQKMRSWRTWGRDERDAFRGSDTSTNCFLLDITFGLTAPLCLIYFNIINLMKLGPAFSSVRWRIKFRHRDQMINTKSQNKIMKVTKIVKIAIQ